MASTSDNFGTSRSTLDPSYSNSNMGQTAQRTADQLSDAASQVQARATEQIDKMTDAIRRNPLQAAGIAAGIGFLLALLARR